MPIEIKGLDRLLERFELMAETHKVSRHIEKACLVVEREAKITAPKMDGALRRSITSKVKGLEGKVYTPLFYAPYVEYGTGLFSIHPMGGRKDVPWVYFDEKNQQYITTYGQEANPFMRPALDNSRNKIVEIIGEGLLKDD